MKKFAKSYAAIGAATAATLGATAGILKAEKGDTRDQVANVMIGAGLAAPIGAAAGAAFRFKTLGKSIKPDAQAFMASLKNIGKEGEKVVQDLKQFSTKLAHEKKAAGSWVLEPILGAALGGAAGYAMAPKKQKNEFAFNGAIVGGSGLTIAGRHVAKTKSKQALKTIAVEMTDDPWHFHVPTGSLAGDVDLGKAYSRSVDMSSSSFGPLHSTRRYERGEYVDEVLTKLKPHVAGDEKSFFGYKINANKYKNSIDIPGYDYSTFAADVNAADAKKRKAFDDDLNNMRNRWRSEEFYNPYSGGSKKSSGNNNTSSKGFDKTDFPTLGFKIENGKVVKKGGITVIFSTKADAKAFYRSKVKTHHPDVGGDHTTMTKLTTEWEDLQKTPEFQKLAFFKRLLKSKI